MIHLTISIVYYLRKKKSEAFHIEIKLQDDNCELLLVANAIEHLDLCHNSQGTRHKSTKSF